jgi:hypothetical protein
VWLVYRIYSSFSTKKNIVFQKHEHHHYKDDELKTNTSNNKKTNSKLDNVEDVDFEEIK